MINIMGEIFELLFVAVFTFIKHAFKSLYQLTQIPTTKYGLVKYFMENNILLFNNQVVTNLIMFVVPLLVSHILVYLCDGFKIRFVKAKEILSILLYLVMLYVFASWQFWAIIGIVTLIAIYLNIKNIILYEE